MGLQRLVIGHWLLERFNNQNNQLTRFTLGLKGGSTSMDNRWAASTSQASAKPPPRLCQIANLALYLALKLALKAGSTSMDNCRVGITSQLPNWQIGNLAIGRRGSTPLNTPQHPSTPLNTPQHSLNILNVKLKFSKIAEIIHFNISTFQHLVLGPNISPRIWALRWSSMQALCPSRIAQGGDVLGHANFVGPDWDVEMLNC